MDPAIERQVSVLRRKAWTYFDARKPDEALRCFDEAISLAPATAALLIEKGEALARLERHDQALLCFERAVAAEPASADALVERGKCLETLLRRDEALAGYEQALALAPEHARALGALG